MHPVDTYLKIPHVCKLNHSFINLKNNQGKKFLLELLVIEETEKENLKEKLESVLLRIFKESSSQSAQMSHSYDIRPVICIIFPAICKQFTSDLPSLWLNHSQEHHVLLICLMNVGHFIFMWAGSIPSLLERHYLNCSQIHSAVLCRTSKGGQNVYKGNETVSLEFYYWV